MGFIKECICIPLSIAGIVVGLPLVAFLFDSHFGEPRRQEEASIERVKFQRSIQQVGILEEQVVNHWTSRYDLNNDTIPDYGILIRNNNGTFSEIYIPGYSPETERTAQR